MHAIELGKESTMGKVTVTNLAALNPEPAIEFLRAKGHDVVFVDTVDPEVLLDVAPDTEALIIGFIPLSEDTLRQLPNLQCIATTSVGVNTISLKQATAQGIKVCNMPPVSREEVATHAMAGLLAMTRALRPSLETVEKGEWTYSGLPVVPRLNELSLGVYSLGSIARKLVELAAPFFKEVHAYDPYVKPEDWLNGVHRHESLDGLLRNSNILSIHAPLTEETSGFLNEEKIGLMPEGAYVINVARGGLVNEPDLLAGLNSGHLSGAFLDVLEEEPPSANNILISHPKVLITPHVAFRSRVTLRDYVEIPAENVAKVLGGAEPDTLVNG